MVRVEELHYIFLLYVPRSGSTWLANQLANKSSEILVLPELKTLEILYGLNDLSDPRRIAKSINSDPRWKNTNIGFSQLLELLQSEKELTPKRILDKLVANIISKRKMNPKAVLFKNGTSLWHVEKIEKHFKRLSFLHIYRDPRGCISSMLKAKAAFRPNEKFTVKNSYQLSKYYKQYRISARAIQNNRLIEINYESLVLDQTRVLKTLLNELNIRETKKHSSLAISEEEKRLHANINKSSLKNRIVGWKNDLSIADGKLVEYMCADYLFGENYFLRTEERPISLMAKKFIQAGLINLTRPFLAIMRYTKASNLPYLRHRISVWMRR